MREVDVILVHHMRCPIFLPFPTTLAEVAAPAEGDVVGACNRVVVHDYEPHATAEEEQRDRLQAARGVVQTLLNQGVEIEAILGAVNNNGLFYMEGDGTITIGHYHSGMAA